MKHVKRYIFLWALAALSLLTAINAIASERISMGGGPQGASFYAWASSWTHIINKNMPNMSISVEVTGGPNDNIRLIQKGEAELGMATTWLAGEAYNKQGWAKEKYDKIRAIYPMYSSVLYFYTLNDKIVTIRDLHGKRIATGAAGSTSEIAANAILKALEIKPASIIPISTSIALNNLRDGLIDVSIGVSGVPAPFLMDLETTHKVYYISMDKQDIDNILKQYPYWMKGVLRKGAYKYLNSDIPIIEFWNIAIASKDLSNDLVYNLVKTTFEKREELIAANQAATQLTTENILNSSIPLHPGAFKYYKEIGIDIPQNLVPPEMK
jgi:uncharacterized protein